MGLDITANRGLIPCALHGNADAAWNARHIYLTIHPELFPERTTPVSEGCYQYAEEFDFRAGSYSGYNRWRDQLSRFAHGVSPETVWGNADYVGKPFYELIEFSDCEGFIGPVVATKLSRDFQEHTSEAIKWSRQYGAEADYWLQKYHDWMKAFRLASDNGVVRFH